MLWSWNVNGSRSGSDAIRPVRKSFLTNTVSESEQRLPSRKKKEEPKTKAIEKNKRIIRFTIKTTQNTWTCDAVILAAGSKASNISGSDGSGYDLAKSLGHSIIPVLPALVQLHCAESFYKEIAGIRVQGRVTLYAKGQKLAEDTGEIQLTNYGISGIPVFQVSRFAAKAIYEKKPVKAVLNSCPTFPKILVLHS